MVINITTRAIASISFIQDNIKLLDALPLMPEELDVVFDPFLPVRDKVIRVGMIRVRGIRGLNLSSLSVSLFS